MSVIALRNILQQHGFTGARRRDDQRALALALRADDVDDARRLVLDRRIKRIERQFLVGIKRREVIEIDAVTNGVGVVEVDLHDLGQGKITLAILGRADFAFDRVAGAQAELAHHVGRDVNIVGTGQIVGFGRTQEAETVGQNLDRAETHDLLAIFGEFFQDREHQILLAQRRCALDAQFFGHRHEVGWIFAFQLFQMHKFIPLDGPLARNDSRFQKGNRREMVRSVARLL